MHRSVGMDVNVLLRGMHGFRMFHNFSLVFRHVLRGNAQHNSFRFPESNFTSTSASPPIGVIFSITPLPNALWLPRGRPF